MDNTFRTSKSRQELSDLLRTTDGWITVEHAARVLRLDRRAAAKRLARWTNQGWLRRVQRGHYTPIPMERAIADAPLEEPWIVVPNLIPGAYVGGWTAAQHWDLTEQIFRDLCVFAPGRSRRLDRAGLTYVVFPAPSEERSGLKAHWAGSTKVELSDPERTLVDMLAEPRAGPGVQHLADCLAAYVQSSRVDLQLLLDRALCVENGAVVKRLGLLLERHRLASEEFLAACRASLTQGLTKLDPTDPCPRLVTRWRVRVPESWTSA